MSRQKDDEEKTPSDSSEETFSLKIDRPFKGPEESIVGTLFVNRENRIKCIISSVSELVDRSSFDENLEIEDFSRQLQYEGIADDINHVLTHQGRVQKEVQGKNGRWYLLELRPHSPEADKDGVVVTFVDVTDLKETKERLAEKIEKNKDLQRQIIKNDVNERWKIGQFLHDDVAQSLVSAKVFLRNLKTEMTSEKENIRGDIDLILDILQESTTKVRNLSHEIVPVDIEEKGLTYAFNNLARQLEKVHDIRCELDYDDTVDNLKNAEIATHLYRIAKEATRNAVDHGDAENVKITLKSDDDYLHQKVEDDGTGLSESATEEEGMGLKIMRHRMDLMGGKFTVKNSSELGVNGATISCKIPTESL